MVLQMSEMDKKISDASPPSEGVKVKALQWGETNDWWGAYAKTPFGTYNVAQCCNTPNGDGVRNPDWFVSCPHEDGLLIRKNEAEAKAAAFDHFSAAIRSALEPTPEHVEGDVLSVGEMATDDIFDWLKTELSAIDIRYRGDPSYDHDAYWFRDRVENLFDDARKAFPEISSAQSRIQRAERERDAQVLRLTEENEALRKGKTDIALTALAADGQAQEAYEKLCAAEARIKALEEALRAVSDTSHRARDRKHYRFPLAVMDKVDAALSGDTL